MYGGVDTTPLLRNDLVIQSLGLKPRTLRMLGKSRKGKYKFRSTYSCDLAHFIYHKITPHRADQKLIMESLDSVLFPSTSLILVLRMTPKT